MPYGRLREGSGSRGVDVGYVLFVGTGGMWHKLRPTHPRECLVSPLSLLRSVAPSRRAQDDGASPHPPANWYHRMGTG